MFNMSVTDKVGTVQAFAGTTPPDGWLFCDGAAISRTTYADLFAAIGTTYGAGDGSTTFNLPVSGVSLGDYQPVSVFGTTNKAIIFWNSQSYYSIAQYQGDTQSRQLWNPGFVNQPPQVLPSGNSPYNSNGVMGLNPDRNYGASGIVGTAILTNKMTAIIKY